MHYPGNTGHIESTLKYFKTTPKREIDQGGDVGGAGTDCFLSGLFRTNDTNPEDPGVGEQDGDQWNNNGQKCCIKSVDIVYCGVSTRKFDYIIVMTVQPVYDVPTQS